MLVPEGSSATFTVERSRGTEGPATIYWSLSEVGRNDLNQSSGNVTFETVCLSIYSSELTLYNCICHW